MPLTLLDVPFFRLPFAGGVYFRALPFLLVRYLFRKRIQTGRDIVGYFHPYDIDPDQRKDAFAEMASNTLFRWLLFYNRKSVLDKLEKLANSGVRIQRYDEFLGLNV